MTNINGTLRNARRLSPSEDVRGPCLQGEVYGDTKGRFFDGESIVTSTIMSEEGDVFRTRYSVYKVESWAGDLKAANDNSSLGRAIAIDDLVSRLHLVAGGKAY